MRVKAGGNANGPVTPTPPVFFVKAVDKGLTGVFFVRFVLSWNKEEGAGAAHLAQRVRNSIAGKELA